MIGGLYGMCIGRMFYGESMFAHETDASKVTLAALVHICRAEEMPWIDCQQETPHLAFMGAVPVPRSEFLRRVESLVRANAVDWQHWRRRNLLPEVLARYDELHKPHPNAP
jgi:leucyl/phenylalanyl-tRNA--protein transferase